MTISTVELNISHVAKPHWGYFSAGYAHPQPENGEKGCLCALQRGY